MPLTPGTKLGQYEVVEAIGAGGMGEVYRARDTKLGRDVAIKVLPEEFARDKERLDRFQREARLLAQVNHANIATLYGLEEHDGQKFIVMELVEGETLAERISKGPLPVDEAIPLFIQIAEGLEAAHENAIIHRDLKPASPSIGPIILRSSFTFFQGGSVPLGVGGRLGHRAVTAKLVKARLARLTPTELTSSITGGRTS